MKVNHTIASIDKNTGGPARSVTHLISQLLIVSKKVFIDLTTLTTQDPIIKSFNKENGKIYFFNKKILFKQSYDLYHAQGIWEKPMHNMVVEARKKNKPYIITVRGMLEPWSLKQSSLKKKIALKLYQYKDLNKATCLHATAKMEVESIRGLGLQNPIAMIPNGINLNEFPESIPVKSMDKKKILFLSRIHPKKGIENLIKAWLLLDNKIREGWVIEIVGNGDFNYIQKLNELIKSKKLEDEISVLPPVFGEKKIQLYRNASLFVLPTFSENFGVVIAEALASFTPVITTKGAPWEDLEKFNCGWWIDIGVEPLKIALEEAMAFNEIEMIEKGLNGRKLVEDKYSINAVAKQMLELYSWILKGTQKPLFIDLYEQK